MTGRPPAIGKGAAEEGAALLTVLLLVAVMAALSAVVLERLRLATHLATNGIALDQARAFAVGGEAVIVARIAGFAGPGIERTTLAGNWNKRAFTIPIPGGLAVARVRDGGNCFNLNSVAEGATATELTTRPAGQQQFVALQEALGIDRGTAMRIAAALADWIDGDVVPNPGGAEDADYARAARPYRTANTLIAEGSELRAVAGVTPEIYATLRPWICALPGAQMSPINVNTLLPDQAPLLAMLLPGRIDVGRAREVLVRRPSAGWGSTADFWRTQTLANLTVPAEAASQVQIKTRWFALDLDVQLAGAQVTETALIDGGLVPARVLLRRWGEGE
ncbi:MAG: type secretory pathway component PulK [Sphingomonas bacterium]|nr:type II secretion system minor pseudopilin GspK [Sphingomonas bacterium]MDB5688361.1 type secretory pathway component PulK [Sphingomonas bacterium]